MRRALSIAVLMVLCLAGAVAQTDEPSEPLDDEEVVFSAPKKNPIYYFGNPFCEHFIDTKIHLGLGDIGVGILYSYIPEVWGFNIGANIGYANLWLAGGASYRLSKPWDNLDCHLYGNLGVTCQEGNFRLTLPTAEVGLRVAAPDGFNKLCLSSCSIGVLTDFQSCYVTVGLGLSAAASVLPILLFLP